MDEFAQIAALVLLRRDDRIGCRRTVHRPEGGLEVDLHPRLRRLPPQLLQAIGEAVGVPVFHRGAAGAGEKRANIEGFVGNGRAMFGGDFLKPLSGQIGKRRDGREEVVNMRHFCTPNPAERVSQTVVLC